MECFTCKSNSGKKRISPGPTIYEGDYWLVEHAYPSKLKGWLVIATKRHVEELHNLTKKEFVEFAEICEKTVKILYKELNCEKEYSMCFAELEHFNHIHFHIVPKPHDLPKELMGSKIFAMLKVEEKDAIPRKVIIDFCNSLKNKF
jgi:diadenosine tetraphosphate (Ap4A) HIT family hydrolase